MKEDKAHVLRKTVIIITIILIFATAGLLLVTTQLKTVRFNYFGNIKEVKTLSGTVESFLIQNKIYVNDKQTLIPSKDTKITNNIEIQIYSNENLAKLNLQEFIDNYKPVIAKIEEVVEDIPYIEEKVNNASMTRGTNKTIQDGKMGQYSTKYIVKYNGTEELYRAELSSTVLSDAQNKVIEVGTKILPLASRYGSIVPVKMVTTDGNFKQYNIKLPVEQQKYAYNLCQKYGIEYELFLATMYKESGYNPNAIGGGNSYGLCQIYITNHAWLRKTLGISNFFDPYDNLDAGAYLLSRYFTSGRKWNPNDSTKAAVYALNSYNMGEGPYTNYCKRNGGGTLGREYSTSILNLRNKLINQGGL